MRGCTFFGHRNCPDRLQKILERRIENLIAEGVTLFYVGNQGNFDEMVRHALIRSKTKHPQIQYYVVLAYVPRENQKYGTDETIIPEGIECVPRKYALSHRNRWMIEHSEYVITYVTHSFGGAAQFEKLARAKGKNIINIAE